MASSSRFAAPVTDNNELELRATAIPTNTKHCTDWGIRVWQEWAGSRAAQDGGILDPLTTPLLQLSPESLAY